ncbi:hypothetical protein AAKU52_002026 [Pedobacter sp. CG_S7]
MIKLDEFTVDAIGGEKEVVHYFINDTTSLHFFI